MNPTLVTVMNPDLPAIKFELHGDLISDRINFIQYELTKNKAYVNSYMISAYEKPSPISVIKYYKNLSEGKGHTTNAPKHDNFDINMRGMLYNILCAAIPDFKTLFESSVISIDYNNLVDVEKESEHIIKQLLNKKDTLNGNNSSQENLNYDISGYQQILNNALMYYFASSEIFHGIMYSVAFKLSYDNEYIKGIVDCAFYKPTYSRSENMYLMQVEFYKLFESQEFAVIIAEEIGKVMTDHLDEILLKSNVLVHAI
jgi:hypothetical protein